MLSTEPLPYPPWAAAPHISATGAGFRWVERVVFGVSVAQLMPTMLNGNVIQVSPRRRFQNRLVGLSAAALLGGGLCLATAAVPDGAPALTGGSTASAAVVGPDADQPNILQITVDDMAIGDLRYLPKINRMLVKRGTNFTNLVAPTPICVPSRASMLSGQLAHNHGAHSISGPQAGFASFKDSRTLPVWLQAAGYDTLFAGKYLNGYGKRNQRYVPPGWTDWRGSIDPFTYDYRKLVLNKNGRVVRKRGYTTNLLAHEANEMLSAPRRTRSPWFFSLNYVAPHTGSPRDAGDPSGFGVQTPSPAAKYRNAYAGKKLPRKPNLWRATRNTKFFPPFSAGKKAAVTELFQQRLEALRSVDDAVAGHLKVLRRTGQLGNTLVVFISDNGMLMGEHNRTGKLLEYRESLQVPMVVRGPGVDRGSVQNSLVANYDLPTTYAALAGATPQRRQDGIDISRLWSGRRYTGRVVPIEAWHTLNGRIKLYEGVRVDDRWTFVRFSTGGKLLDLRRDPYETVNVARLAKNRKIRAKLQRWMLRYDDCSGSSCPRSVHWRPQRG